MRQQREDVIYNLYCSMNFVGNFIFNLLVFELEDEDAIVYAKCKNNIDRLFLHCFFESPLIYICFFFLGY